MVTRATQQLTIDTFLDVVIKKIFPLLSLGWYLFTVVNHNGYLARGSNGNVHSITMNGNGICCQLGNTFGNHTIFYFVMSH